MDDLVFLFGVFAGHLRHVAHIVEPPAFLALHDLARSQRELSIGRVNNALMVQVEIDGPQVDGLIPQPAIVMRVGEDAGRAERTQADKDFVHLRGVVRPWRIPIAE